MTIRRNTIGRVPTLAGAWDASYVNPKTGHNGYPQKKRVTHLGSEFESLIEDNTYAPATLNQAGTQITFDTEHWLVISNGTDAYLLQNTVNEKLEEIDDVKDAIEAEQASQRESMATMQNTINAKQLEIGAVQTDPVPTQNSGNHMTSGDIYQTLKDSSKGFVDNVPAPDSDKIAKSGGVLNSIIQNGPAFNLSAYNDGEKYADLAEALTALNSLPSVFKKGGMSVKFVQSSDNKYVQYLYHGTSTAVADFINTDNWEKTNLEAEVDELSHIIDDIVNLSLFAADSSNFVSLSGKTLTINSTDGRPEANHKYRVHLKRGTHYIAFDKLSNLNFVIQLYDPNTQELIYIHPPKTVEKSAFTVNADGYFAIKFLGNEYPLVTENFNIYTPSSKDYIIPSFTSGITVDEAISNAIRIAWGSDIKKVVIPPTSGEYILQGSIFARSNVCISTDYSTKFKLANSINLPMIINQNHSNTAMHYDNNICIDGGIWDGNGANQVKFNHDYGNEIVVGMAFVGVDNITIKNAVICNTRVYGNLFSNCNDIEMVNCEVNVGDVSHEDNVDGIHFLGPSVNINLHDCKVKSEDNCIAVTAYDGECGVRYTSRGDIENVNISNIFLNNSKGQGILLLSTSYKLQNVSVHSIRGITGYFLNISNFGFESGSGNYKGINVYDVEVTIDGQQEDCIRVTADIDDVSFRDIYMKTNWDDVWQRKFLKLYTIGSNTCNINSLILDNVNVNCDTVTSKPFYLITQEGGNVYNLSINNFVSIGNKCPVYFMKCNGGITRTTIRNCNLTNLYNGLIWIDQNGSMDNIIIDNVVFDNVSAPRVCNPYNKVIAFSSVLNMGDFEINSTKFIINRQNDLNGNALIWYKQGEVLLQGRYIDLCTNSGSMYNNELEANAHVLVGQKFTNQNNTLVCVYEGTTGDDVSGISTSETDLIFSGTAQFLMYHKGKATFTEGEWQPY